MTTDQLTRDNAYAYTDTYALWDENRMNFYGCEHNQEEAEAIAKWITYNRNSGYKVVVVKNGPDLVRRATEIRGRDVVRYQLREEALRDMGIWPTAPKRRRSR